MSYAKDCAEYARLAERAGIDQVTADAIRKDAQRLHTFYIQYCNGDIEVDEAGKASRPIIRRDGSRTYYPAPNPEPSARKRIETLCAGIGAERLEINRDPRGWPVRYTVKGVTLCPPCRYR